MGNNAKTTEFLKECMADALISLMARKPFTKITVDEIAGIAGVHRSTWFRNFTSKNDALTFKLELLWSRWADEHELKERKKYSIDNAVNFFQFNHKISHLLQRIYDAGLQSAVYDTFYRVMMPQHEENTEECYKGRFFSYGLFGLLDEWIKRDFYESPEEMVRLFYRIAHASELAG